MCYVNKFLHYNNFDIHYKIMLWEFSQHCWPGSVNGPNLMLLFTQHNISLISFFCGFFKNFVAHSYYTMFQNYGTKIIDKVISRREYYTSGGGGGVWCIVPVFYISFSCVILITLLIWTFILIDSFNSKTILETHFYKIVWILMIN